MKEDNKIIIVLVIGVIVLSIVLGIRIFTNNQKQNFLKQHVDLDQVLHSKQIN